jgi:hypothetical protein
MGLWSKIHTVRYWTLSCDGCHDFLEAFPSGETRGGLVRTARECGWKSVKGEVLCNKCLKHAPAPRTPTNYAPTGEDDTGGR